MRTSRSSLKSVRQYDSSRMYPGRGTAAVREEPIRPRPSVLQYCGQHNTVQRCFLHVAVVLHVAVARHASGMLSHTRCHAPTHSMLRAPTMHLASVLAPAQHHNTPGQCISTHPAPASCITHPQCVLPQLQEHVVGVELGEQRRQLGPLTGSKPGGGARI